MAMFVIHGTVAQLADLRAGKKVIPIAVWLVPTATGISPTDALSTWIQANPIPIGDMVVIADEVQTKSFVVGSTLTPQ